MPRARQAAAAAIALARLCAPGSEISVTSSSGSSSHHRYPARSDSSAPADPNGTRRAHPPRSSTPRSTGATATSSLPWLAKILSLAPTYSANVPWRSRWSGSRLSSTATSGAKAIVSSSWNEDASHTMVACAGTAPTSDVSAVPTLPATATGKAASR